MIYINISFVPTGSSVRKKKSLRTTGRNKPIVIHKNIYITTNHIYKLKRVKISYTVCLC